MNASRHYQAVVELPRTPLDIIGDVHGEADALNALLAHLGYGPLGEHPEGRKPVFVGDLCDRGPDSPAVIARVKSMVEAGNAICVMGNHELNLLRGQRKDGNNWFWNEESAGDDKFGNVHCISKDEQGPILAFFAGLPLMACSPELRVVHAAWVDASVQDLRSVSIDNLIGFFNAREAQTSAIMRAHPEFTNYLAEQETWRDRIADIDSRVPFLKRTAAMRELRQMANPVRVLTSGVEASDTESFFSGGEWRFVQRVRWWDNYNDTIPVLIGHYWRNPQQDKASEISRGRELFAGIAPFAWHGKKGNVFCLDYCVGARFLERSGQLSKGQTRLAAMRWPERTLIFDDGSHSATSGFQQSDTPGA